MSDFAVRLASAEDRLPIHRMLELYQHDLSDIWGQDLDSHGEYGYALDHHWEYRRRGACRLLARRRAGVRERCDVIMPGNLPGNHMDLHRVASVALLAAAAWAFAAPLPYNESADAKAEIQQALSTAGATKRNVLVVFGANWCEDCRALDASLKNQKNADLLSKEFVVVKVDVGNFDRNGEITTQYGNPTKKGIPAALILSPSNQILYATRAGELSSARRMSEAGVYAFFSQAVAASKEKK